MDFRQAKFLLSAVSTKTLPATSRREVAWVGRSNAGKSSAINVLTNQKKLAKTSKTPGRTQALNYFALNPEADLFLVDLPGYGFAAAAKDQQRVWHKLIGSYLRERLALSGLVLVVDIRRALLAIDFELLNLAAQYRLAVHIIFTKADKLSKQQQRLQLDLATKQLQQWLIATATPADLVSYQIFSAQNKLGLSELQQKLTLWLMPVSN